MTSLLRAGANGFDLRWRVAVAARLLPAARWHCKATTSSLRTALPFASPPA
jgi:hypothetical protein